MNQEIKEYWEKFHGRKADVNGHICWIKSSDDPNSAGGFIVAMKYSALKELNKSGRYNDTHLSHLKDDDWTYPFNEEINDEATMLRLIKLKAFL